MCAGFANNGNESIALLNHGMIQQRSIIMETPYGLYEFKFTIQNTKVHTLRNAIWYHANSRKNSWTVPHEEKIC